MQIEVVDDASTTGDPAAVVEAVGKGRVGFHRHPENVGAARNFSACAQRSYGEWVHILHSDDVVLPGFYDRYRERIAQCPDAVMVGAQTLYVDAQERYVGVTPPLETVGGCIPHADHVLAAQHPLRCVSMVVRRTAYEKAGGFDPTLSHTNDWELMTRMAGLGPVAWVDSPLGLYRTHPDSDSNRLHQSTGYLDDCLRAVELVTARLGDDVQRSQVRSAMLRFTSEYALDVAAGLVHRGWHRAAAKNALRGARIDPSVHSWSRAGDVLWTAVKGRLAAARR
jgi:glycosyltransferase involved in cell wall biosynthesis